MFLSPPHPSVSPSTALPWGSGCPVCLRGQGGTGVGTEPLGASAQRATVA